MKHIAVVGFTNTKQFRDWAYDKLHEKITSHQEIRYSIGKNFVIDENKKIIYYCILCEEDICGRMFNEIIEVDHLRLALRLRLKSED